MCIQARNSIFSNIHPPFISRPFRIRIGIFLDSKFVPKNPIIFNIATMQLYVDNILSSKHCTNTTTLKPNFTKYFINLELWDLLELFSNSGPKYTDPDPNL